VTISAAGSGKAQIAYLSGAVRDEALGYRTRNFGILVTPLMGNTPVGPGLHAHDNGVFTEWKTKGKKPFNLDAFLRHLDKWHGVRRSCLFAVAPDVIGDWQATLARSAPVLPLIRAKGYRAALVAQDGLENHLDAIPWGTFDVLFLGGGQDPKYVSKTNRVRVKGPTGRMRWVGEWKLTPGAARVVAAARARGVDVHMGRVNSLKRLRYAQAIGCTSADGTIIGYAPDVRTPEVQGWLRETDADAADNASICYVCRGRIEAWAKAQHVEPAMLYARELARRAGRPDPHQTHPARPRQAAVAA